MLKNVNFYVADEIHSEPFIESSDPKTGFQAALLGCHNLVPSEKEDFDAANPTSKLIVHLLILLDQFI